MVNMPAAPANGVDKGGAKASRKSNSHKRAGPLSKLLFLWLLPLFRRGNARDLTTADLCSPHDRDLSRQLTDKLERNWILEVERGARRRREPSLLRALMKTFLSSYLLDGVLMFIMAIFRSFLPIVLAFLIEYFDQESTTSKDSAYMYASGVVLLTLACIFIQHHTCLRQMQLGMRLRISCCSLLYRKVLRLNSKSLGETTAGKLVNLMSNDVSRFDMIMLYLHHLWIMPMQIALICYLIYTRVSTAALIGVVSMVLQTLPLQGYMSKVTSNLRQKIAVRTDERVRLMGEIISGIQVIKMYAWEKPFEAMVEKARAYELRVITSTSYLRGVYLSFMVFTERATLYVTLLAYCLMGNKVTSATVFSLAQFYNTLQAITAIIFPSAISMGAECMVTIARLQKFLMLEEREDLCLSSATMANVKLDSDKNKQPVVSNISSKGIANLGYDPDNDNEAISVALNGVTARWTPDTITLDNITLKIPKGKLCAIIGSVGSGKSSILQMMLNELPITSGSMSVNGTISYASQEAWLFVATVRNNILFGLPYDQQRYREVVRVCALEKDFQQFPRGDQTLVGERGVSLSGGQRARINLARAVYRQANVYLLDDPLSAVDAHVGRHLFSQCIGKYLKGRTTILVTHQLHYLHAADIIVILKNGRIENIGSYEELAVSGQDFASLLAALSENKEVEHKDNKKVNRRVSVVSTGSIANPDNQEDEDEEEEIEEEQQSGNMKSSVYWKYIRAGGSFCFMAFMVLVMILGQLAASASDYWVTYWTNQQSIHDARLLQQASMQANGSVLVQYTSTSATPLVKPNGQLDIYENIGPLNTAEYLYIYTAIIVLCIVLTISRTILFFKACMNASKRLHDQMFHNVLRGVMRFFDTNPSGRILNRFSKDIGALDEVLPKASTEAVQIMLVMVSILVLVSITNVWMLLPVALVLVVFYAIFILYINTAQDIKRLEGITKSPVFSHVSTSLNGITTIRASKASQRLGHDFDNHQDLHTSAWYQYISCSCTLGFWLDMVCTIFLAVVTFSFVIFDNGSSLSGNVGLAISQSLILTGMLQFGIRQTAEIISQMTSVERVLQYNKIEQEINLDSGDAPTPEGWPSKGTIQFDHTFLKYSPDDPPVLKDLNIFIQNGWKVGIVGRTGAGKSSLISALFRLAKLEGEIHIDSLETGKIALQDLRSRISIIPQEPVLFSASVRYNLDPFNAYDDASLWRALEAVELKETMPSLDHHVAEGGSNFSLGQRQLVCLARAILRNNQILLLDEATANVDPQTDFFIQKTIREKFSHCTVLTIAHRLNTVMDSDRVLVMDSGITAEFNHPHVLLQNQDGHLYKMVQETGPDMAMKLHSVAKEAFLNSGDGQDVIENVIDEGSEGSDETGQFYIERL